MIDIKTVSGFWYDGNTPIAELVDGREVVLSEEDAQHILDWTASITSERMAWLQSRTRCISQSS